MNPKVKYGLGAAALAVVASIQVFSILGGDDEPTRAEDPSSGTVPTVAVTPDAPSSTTPGEDETVVGEVLDTTLIETVAKAYGEFSWNDPKPYAWMDRYGPLCTDEYAATLPSAYPFTAVDEADWEVNVVDPRATGRVVDVHKKTLGGSEEEGEVSFKVTYRTEISYERPEARGFSHDGAAPEPAEPGEWIDAGKAQYAIVFVEEDGVWKVSHQERYVPAPEGPHDHDHDTESDTDSESDTDAG